MTVTNTAAVPASVLKIRPRHLDRLAIVYVRQSTPRHVGIVFGREMSRLARSCKDWHQLLELCGLFQVLIGDADGVYDPTDANDRMLLGLRGMMSEAELHVLRSRLHQGKVNKARRGEAFSLVPIGYVRAPEGGIALESDEQ